MVQLRVGGYPIEIKENNCRSFSGNSLIRSYKRSSSTGEDFRYQRPRPNWRFRLERIQLAETPLVWRANV
jgi:hypothetical protein